MNRKVHMRQRGLARLKQLSHFPKIKAKKEQSLYMQLFGLKSWQDAKVVAVTISLDFEVATQPIIERAFQEKKCVVVPKVFPNGNMGFFEITPVTEFIITDFGAAEPLSNQLVLPDDIDLQLVPGIVFSEEGYRIGFGGGFYDRYLTEYSGQTISLVFKDQLQPSWPIDSFDVAVQTIIQDDVKELYYEE